jgi:ATP dependent DNA ligase domain
LTAFPSDFNGLHSRQHDDEVQLYAFDVMALDREDLRKLPLHLRKTNLARLLARRPEGIFVSEFEQGEIGRDLFRKACEFGLEGMVSKRRESRSTAGARVADRGWQPRFDEPIPLPRGRQLLTLRDAGAYITKLPKAEHEAAE